MCSVVGFHGLVSASVHRAVPLQSEMPRTARHPPHRWLTTSSEAVRTGLARMLHIGSGDTPHIFAQLGPPGTLTLPSSGRVSTSGMLGVPEQDEVHRLHAFRQGVGCFPLRLSRERSDEHSRASLTRSLTYLQTPQENHPAAVLASRSSLPTRTPQARFTRGAYSRPDATGRDPRLAKDLPCRTMHLRRAPWACHRVERAIRGP
jgi:hypothetical protein